MDCFKLNIKKLNNCKKCLTCGKKIDTLNGVRIRQVDFEGNNIKVNLCKNCYEEMLDNKFPEYMRHLIGKS